MSRRRFIGIAASAIPAIITLRSGSVLAYTSCSPVGAIGGKVDGEYTVGCIKPDLHDQCSGNSVGHGILVEPIMEEDEGDLILRCPANAFAVSNGAFTSILG